MAKTKPWVRTRVCDCCGAIKAIRKDNPATTCGRCSRLRSLTVARAAKPPARPKAPPRRLPRVPRTCKFCEKAFSVPPSVLSGKTNSSANFCSRGCYSSWLCRTGRTTGRGSRWTASSKEALRRAPFCGLCGTRRRLQVHHIVPWRLTRDNGQDNLIPLCVKHHRLVETATVEIENSVEDPDAVPALLAPFSLMLRFQQARTAAFLRRITS